MPRRSTRTSSANVGLAGHAADDLERDAAVRRAVQQVQQPGRLVRTQHGDAKRTMDVQHMRGSSSPSGSATSRRPNPVSRITMPGWSAVQVPTIAASRPSAMRAQRREDQRRRRPRGRRSAPCLRWRRAADRCRPAPRRRGPQARTGSAASSSTMPTPLFAAISCSALGGAAARRILHRRHGATRRVQRGARPVR